MSTKRTRTPAVVHPWPAAGAASPRALSALSLKNDAAFEVFGELQLHSAASASSSLTRATVDVYLRPHSDGEGSGPVIDPDVILTFKPSSDPLPMDEHEMTAVELLMLHRALGAVIEKAQLVGLVPSQAQLEAIVADARRRSA
jgi:hypothetical protein